jgi:hypothetical protein
MVGCRRSEEGKPVRRLWVKIRREERTGVQINQEEEKQGTLNWLGREDSPLHDSSLATRLALAGDPGGLLIRKMRVTVKVQEGRKKQIEGEEKKT